jgi:hypothetical protein
MGSICACPKCPRGPVSTSTAPVAARKGCVGAGDGAGAGAGAGGGAGGGADAAADAAAPAAAPDVIKVEEPEYYAI